MAWEYEVTELSEGVVATVYDEKGRMVADHLSEEHARLTAAAPEMSDALKEAERFMAYFAGETDLTFEGPGTPKSCLAIIRAAISKATDTKGGTDVAQG